MGPRALRWKIRSWQKVREDNGDEATFCLEKSMMPGLVKKPTCEAGVDRLV